jgi:Ser/Thr protein kinase RdoA (MazF antagonist)
VPGAPVEMPTQAQAEAALATLARIHLAAAAWPESPPSRGPSPGIDRRIEQAQRLLADPWAGRRSRLSGAAEAALPGHGAELRGLFDAAIAGFAACGTRAVGRIARCGPTPVLAQAVLRDVWSDHVLFVGGGDVVGGIIDYHAAGIDTPATDLARLLGSWRAAATGCDGPLAARWPTAVAAYERHRPLAAGERRLIDVLHASAVVFGLDHWFRWTLEERRAFGRPDLVLGRIGRLLEELPSALRLLDQADWAGLTG